MVTRTHITKTEEGQAEKAVQIRAVDPVGPIANQTWINSTEDKLKYFDGVTKVITASAGNLSIVSKSANYTVLSSDDVILGDATGASFTLTLPTAVGNSGKILKLYKEDISVNEIIVDGDGAELINGNASTSINSKDESLELISDNVGWKILSRKSDTAWTAFVPTGNMTTNATYTGFKRRVGEMLEVNMKISFAGNTDAVNLSVDMPTLLVMDAAKMFIEENDVGINNGSCMVKAAGVRFLGGATVIDSVSLKPFVYSDLGANETISQVTNTVPSIITAGDEIIFKYSVPVVGWKSANE